MSRFRLLAAAAATVLLALLLPTAPASAAASAVLTYGSAGGTAVPVGDTLSANLKSNTLLTFYSTTTGTTGVKCTSSSFSARVVTNPAASGTATEDNVNQTIPASSCTINVAGTTGVAAISLNTPYNASVTSAGVVTVTPGAAGTIQTTNKINTLIGPVTCVYNADGNTLTGTASNADNSITFTNQKFNKVSGPSLCFNPGYFSAKYAPVSGPGGLVFVN